MTVLLAHGTPETQKASGGEAAADTVAGMATEVRLTLPDDVAEFLTKVDDASEFVADAVRRRMWGPIVREQLEAAGFNITDEGVERARVEMDRIRSSITPELRAKAAELYAEVMRMRAGRHA